MEPIHRHCVIIPDLHQHVAWLQRVLAREPNADLYVFLGDYFDSKLPPKRRAGVIETCNTLSQLQSQLGQRAVFLLGNHDIQYLEARRACLHHRVPRNLRYRCGGSFHASAALKIAKSLPESFWASTQLYTLVNGWLLSHAGIAPAFWPTAESLPTALRLLQQACDDALRNINHHSHPLLGAGPARGGDQSVPGLTWMDWDEEFCDALPYPQIVGHSGHPSGARSNGRSYCIDGQQSTYACLIDGRLTIRTA